MRTLPTFREVAVLIAVSGLCLQPGAPARADGSAPREGGVSVLLATINHERRARHERLLRLDGKLCRIAFEHAADMARNHYFDHFSLDGRSPFERMRDSNYRFGYAGENLALDVDARSASEALWNSREHRSNLLEPHYAHVGIAAVPLDGEIIVVEDFSD
jgi:uncharacterized protein YkwD